MASRAFNEAFTRSGGRPIGATAPGGARRRGRGGRHGFSLVEVLVVLVVLAIGMFAIIRMFPEGFNTINQSGNITVASAMSKFAEDLYNNRRENLPDAVVALDPDNFDPSGFPLIQTFVTPDQLTGGHPYLDNTINGLAPGDPIPDDPRFSHANRVRRVLGETVKVPPAKTDLDSNGQPMPIDPAGDLAPSYRALFAPIYSASPMKGSSLGVSVYAGTPLQRVVFRNEGTTPNDDDLEALRAAGPFGYGIDYDQGLLYFLAAPYPRTYKVEFTYRTGPAAPLQSVPNNALFVGPAGQADPGSGPVLYQQWSLGQVQNGPNSTFIPVPANARLEPGSDLLHRQLTQITPTVSFTVNPDPYEYKIYDPLTGLFGFDPVLASLPTPSQQGRGLLVKIDYDVDDWHILRQDEAVPTASVDATQAAGSTSEFFNLELVTTGIKRVGEPEDTISFAEGSPGGTVDAALSYQGLRRYYPPSSRTGAPARAGTPGIDVIIEDLDTGYYLDSSSLQKTGTADPLVPFGGNNLNGEIDYEAGIIHLRRSCQFNAPGGLGQTRTLSVPGRQLRVYYRSTRDYGVATLQPHAGYLRQTQAQVLADQQFFTYPAGGFLLFNGADIERTVAVDYSWQSASTGAVRMEIGELHKIDTTQSPFAPALPAGMPRPEYGWLRLNNADPTAAGDTGGNPDVVPGSISVRSVRGASIQTRVIWRQGKRWKQTTRTTLLSRGQSR